MSEKELAQHIIRLVGGKENIASVQHCATRLRIVVHDKDKINVKEVENLDKVKGSFFNAGQYQIILGTGLVNRVYDEAMTQLNLAAESPVPEDTTSKPVYGNKFQRDGKRCTASAHIGGKSDRKQRRLRCRQGSPANFIPYMIQSCRREDCPTAAVILQSVL